MRTLGIPAAVAAALLFVLSAGPGGAGEWTAEIEGLALWREGPDATAMVGDVNPGPFATGANVLGTDDIDFLAPGGRGTLAYWVNDGSGFEIVGLGLFDNGRKRVEDPFTEDMAGAFCDQLGPCTGEIIGLGAFGGTAQATLDFDSRLIGGEVNHRVRVGKHVELLGGFRFVHLGEELRLDVFDDVSGGIVFTNPGNYTVATRNDLFGGQVGVDAALPVTQGLRVVFLGKGGVYWNRARKEASITDFDGAPPTRLTDKHRTDRLAGILDGSLVVEVTLLPGFTVSAGYSALFLTGISSAPDQFMNANTFAQFTKHESASLLYHGPLLRLIATY